MFGPGLKQALLLHTLKLIQELTLTPDFDACSDVF